MCGNDTRTFGENQIFYKIANFFLGFYIGLNGSWAELKP
jgi:hypothetical protein